MPVLLVSWAQPHLLASGDAVALFIGSFHDVFCQAALYCSFIPEYGRTGYQYVM